MVDIVKVISERPLSEDEINIAKTFAIKSSHQKKQGRIALLDSKSGLILARSLISETGSKFLAIIVNYLMSVRLSLVHHVYHENSIGIPNLIIKDQIALSKIKFGQIGEYCGIPLWHSQYKPIERFPPLLINSKSETPITITVNKKPDHSLAPRNVSITDDTVLANCSKIFESELKSAMNAHLNVEKYKRFCKDLSKIIKEQF